MDTHSRLLRLDPAPDAPYRVEDNRWVTLAALPAAEVPAAPAGPGPLLRLLPCAAWLAQDKIRRTLREEEGLWLAPDDEPEALAEAWRTGSAVPAVLAVHFPGMTDGRGFSIARLLRERYAYRGELRAIGDVQQDALGYLRRCGFDAFEIPAAVRDVAAWAQGLGWLTRSYQASVTQPEPLFRQRT